MPLRSNRASEGDGLRAALAAGAATSEGMDGFYGHLISWPTDVWVPGVYTLLSQYHSHRAALVNRDGELFEPPFPSDHYNAQWVVRQPEGRAVMVFDRLLYEDQGSPVSTGERPNAFEIAAEHGAHAARAETLAELGSRRSPSGGSRPTTWPRRWPPSTARPPAAADRDRAAVLRPRGEGGDHVHARRCAHRRRGPGPRRLGAAGARACWRRAPTPAGCTTAGYGGGLATAGVFGLRAADTVLADLGPA